MIASNTGPSAVVDPWGRVLTEIPTLFAEGIAVADVPLGGPPALYTRWGDAFAFFSAAVAALGLALRKCRTVHSPRPHTPIHRTEIVTDRE